MVTTGIIGKPRTGKTLYLCMMAYFDYLAGRKIWTNFPVYFPPIPNNVAPTPLEIEDIQGIVDMEMEISPKSVFIQEASKWFDARRSMRKENVLLSSFTGQSGKREIDIYYDDQFPTRIDMGLRDITDYTMIPEALPSHPMKPFVFRYHQYAGYFDFDMSRSVVYPAQFMESFYPLYDTRKPTMPLERIKELEEQTKEKRGRPRKDKSKIE